MAGHNKWSKVKRKKEVADKEKSRIFSSLARTITIEARASGGNKESPGLRRAIEKAKDANMPNTNIDKAIQKGMGMTEGAQEEIVYEAYGPGGVAIIIVALTDNKNRTVSEVKHILSEYGVELASPGSALWAFRKEGNKWLANQVTPLEEKDGVALNEIVEELFSHDDITDIFTNAQR